MGSEPVTRTFHRKVGEKTIKVELSTGVLSVGDDVEDDASQVPALMGLVGELIAWATYELEFADASYRHWRAKRGRACERGLAEWKVRQEVEADEHFLEWKRQLAEKAMDVEWLRAYMNALRSKASMIRGTIEHSRYDRETVGLLHVPVEEGFNRKEADRMKRRARRQKIKSAVRRQRET